RNVTGVQTCALPIYEVSSDFPTVAARSDIIILAAPISASIQLLRELDNITFDQKVIVSDVSSVKGTIFDVASELKNEQIVFIGGHPRSEERSGGKDG